MPRRNSSPGSATDGGGLLMDLSPRGTPDSQEGILYWCPEERDLEWVYDVGSVRMLFIEREWGSRHCLVGSRAVLLTKAPEGRVRSNRVSTSYGLFEETVAAYFTQARHPSPSP